MTDTVVPPAAVRLERSFDAEPARVYAAWLDPAMVKVWMAPGSFDVALAEVDARIGGRFRVWHADGDAAQGGFDGEFLELVPAERIVMALGMLGPEHENGPVFESRLTLTFAENDGGGTDLTLVHERFEEFAAAKPDVAANIEIGWQMVLEKLAALVG